MSTPALSDSAQSSDALGLGMSSPMADSARSGDAFGMLYGTTAISPAEVQWYLSNPGATVGYSGNGTPGAGLGGWMSVTQVSATPLDDIFTDLTIAENDASQTDYQCVFVSNFTVTGYTMKNPYVWLPKLFYTTGAALFAAGLDPAGVLPYQSGTQQAAKIANALTAPPVTAWYGPCVNYTLGLPLPDIPPGYAVPVWLQRTATNSSAFTPQTLSLQITFTSDM